MMESTACTIIIPAFNESPVIAETLRTILRDLSTTRQWRILVVDDGSSDATSDTARQAMGNAGEVIRHERCRGKAGAIVTGVQACRTDRLLFTDADLSVPVAFFEPMAALLDEAEVAIASRRLPGSVLARRQPWIRETCGEIFRRMVRAAFMPAISDFTCGLKAFRTDAARRLFHGLHCMDWTFDVEVLLRAERACMKIRELPVQWSNRADSRVRIGSAIVRSLWSLLRLWRLYP